MKLFKNQKGLYSISDIFNKYVVNGEVLFPDDFIFLYELVAYFRPENPKKIKSVTLIDLVAFLILNEDQRIVFAGYLTRLLKGRILWVMMASYIMHVNFTEGFQMMMRH